MRSEEATSNDWDVPTKMLAATSKRPKIVIHTALLIEAQKSTMTAAATISAGNETM